MVNHDDWTTSGCPHDFGHLHVAPLQRCSKKNWVAMSCYWTGNTDKFGGFPRICQETSNGNMIGINGGTNALLPPSGMIVLNYAGFSKPWICLRNQTNCKTFPTIDSPSSGFPGISRSDKKGQHFQQTAPKNIGRANWANTHRRRSEAPRCSAACSVHVDFFP